MKRGRGFTIVELMVVLAVMGMLLALALPRYVDQVDRSRETVLKHNLKLTREAIGRYRADRGVYPASLQGLVSARYLSTIPLDPITDRADTWISVAPSDGASGLVFDLRSGARGVASDGTSYDSW